MEAKAIGRYLRVTPRKARFVIDTVRGKSTTEALATLKFVPNEAARFIEDVIESAVANAEHNFALDRAILKINRATVDVGPTMKRIHPRAMGRAFRILKRTSHITVWVAEDESLRKPIEKPKRAKTAAKKAAPKKAETAAKAETKKAVPKKPKAAPKAETEAQAPATEE
ncbi:MAG: 50S ribosomal protein L22 [Armatimonadota bacterium]